MVWLCKAAPRQYPLKELYVVSPFSEPTCREAVRAFRQCRYLSLTTSDEDKRVTLIAATPKLLAMANRYIALLARAAQVDEA